ncbi:MAG: putative O-glycosylation ligase, exosortase A system-associated [Planctomycetes bacterium]|nr:putative O-glycosylation ligase, exosortase A system-associated [Planctomycetota bacterium]
MSLRDLIVVSFVLLSLPASFRVPYTGLLMFTWLAYMRAQDLCWGFARQARLSYVVAATMVAGFFVNELGRVRFTVWDVRTLCMVAMAMLIGLSLIDARQYDQYVQDRYAEYLKIVLIALFVAGQVTTRNRMHLMVWTIAISLGFYGFKNGLWAIATGGRQILRGPGGMLEDNNDFALALTMNVPFLLFLAKLETRKFVKRGLQAATALTAITVFCTYSRGAFLSICGVFGIFILRSRYKLIALGVAAAGALLFLAFAPAALMERYGMIAGYEGDRSAEGRLVAWGVAIRMALDNPILGVGFRNFRANFTDYFGAPVGMLIEVHSSWFQIWAETGTTTLLVFLTMLFTSFRTLRKLMRIGRQHEGGEWIADYAVMLEASIVGYCIGATFLNRAHFDLMYHCVALVTALNVLTYQWLALPAHDRVVEGDDIADRPPLEVAGRAHHRGFRRPGQKRQRRHRCFRPQVDG